MSFIVLPMMPIISAPANIRMMITMMMTAMLYGVSFILLLAFLWLAFGKGEPGDEKQSHSSHDEDCR